MSLGTTLREARERKGYTTEYVAEQTRMMRQLVEELEQDDFHRIVAAIYGRGFIKLYAECLEIDPAPLLAEFNITYKGFRHLGKRPEDAEASAPEANEAREKTKPAVKKLSYAHNDDGFDFADSADAAPGLPASKSIEYKAPGVVVAEEPSQPAPAEQDIEVDRSVPVPNEKADIPTPPPAARDKTEIISESAQDQAEKASVPTTRVFHAEEPAKPAAPLEIEKPIVPASTPLDRSGKDNVDLTDNGDEHENADHPESAKDSDSILGELFAHKGTSAIEREANVQPPPKNSPAKHLQQEEPHSKIPVFNPAPSWNDKPLDDSDVPTPWFRAILGSKIKLAVAALGVLVVIAVAVFAIAAGRHAPAVTSTDVPTSGVQPPSSNTPAPSAATVEKAVVDGTTLFSKNLVSPPDSYVE